MQKNKIRLLSFTIHKTQFKWIKYLNERLETIILLHDNLGKRFITLVLSMSS
jgi:hypothetical protein